MYKFNNVNLFKHHCVIMKGPPPFLVCLVWKENVFDGSLEAKVFFGPFESVQHFLTPFCLLHDLLQRDVTCGFHLTVTLVVVVAPKPAGTVFDANFFSSQSSLSFGRWTPVSRRPCGDELAVLPLPAVGREADPHLAAHVGAVLVLDRLDARVVPFLAQALDFAAADKALGVDRNQDLVMGAIFFVADEEANSRG